MFNIDNIKLGLNLLIKNKKNCFAFADKIGPARVLVHVWYLLMQYVQRAYGQLCIRSHVFCVAFSLWSDVQKSPLHTES